MRLAWLTDIHLNFVGPAEITALCRAIIEQIPDTVLIGGDIAEAEDLECHLELLADRLQRPIYFCLGNHDYYGASIADVRARVTRLAAESRWLCWLDTAGVIELTATTGLVGQGAWGDGRLGDYEHSRVLLNDYLRITDFIGLDSTERRPVLAALGQEAADYLRAVLPQALDRFPHVLLLTHYPPFEEACWHEGRVSDRDIVPHFTCGAVGEVLLELMGQRPDRLLTVLCGHTHGAGDSWLLPNLHVRTGGARYEHPMPQASLFLR